MKNIKDWIDIDVFGIKVPARIVLWIIYILDVLAVAGLISLYIGDIVDVYVEIAAYLAGGLYLIVGLALLNIKKGAPVLKFYAILKTGAAVFVGFTGVYCLLFGFIRPSVYFIITIFVGSVVTGIGYIIYWQTIIWKRAVKALIGKSDVGGVPLTLDHQLQAQLQQPVLILAQPLYANPNMGMAYTA
eukprot:TRINITY_DN3283_c0_g2_i2.p1 TRINITY_DN3283_c0_g2~~TRINITY_DN3283_c0_g2_i2.p1  ORF type:complete len:187 (-),score=24.42 TRINITY_DN3283_c0_g2_i2:113-673(-)